MFKLKSTFIPRTEGAYVVGGSIRDLILGRNPTDYDIAVLENPEKFAKKLATKTGGRLVTFGKPGQTIFRIISGKTIFDVSSLNGGSIEEDLRKRDFTINAMAYELSSGKIFDCLGGKRDLAAKSVRMVSPMVFRNDPIRLIRAYRMGALLNFEIDTKTVSVIRNEATLIQQTAAERVREELFRMLGTPGSYAYISQMAESGLLFVIFPELERLKAVLQNNHHRYDAFGHTMKAFYHLEKLLNNIGEFGPEIREQIFRYVNTVKVPLLKCAILLHDIGKPAAQMVGRDGKVRFFDHARIGTDMADHIAGRLKFSTRDSRYVNTIVRHHMQPLLLFNAASRGALTKKGILRFFNKSGDETPGIMLHAVADMRAKEKIGNEDIDTFTTFSKEMIHEYLFHFKPLMAKLPFITGNDLINEFGLTPSPLFKTILNRVEQAMLSEKIKSRPEAFKFVKNLLETKNLRGYP